MKKNKRIVGMACLRCGYRTVYNLGGDKVGCSTCQSEWNQKKVVVIG